MQAVATMFQRTERCIHLVPERGEASRDPDIRQVPGWVRAVGLNIECSSASAKFTESQLKKQ
jgi:hypothetical protein